MNFVLLENAPCVECMDNGFCYLLKHSNIIAPTYWILLLKHSLLVSQGLPSWHTFHTLMSAKNKRPIKRVKPKLTPLYFHSSHAWYAWLLYYKIKQFFLECVILHECNNNFAFLSHSSIYTAILSIHCFFFPLVYNTPEIHNVSFDDLLPFVNLQLGLHHIRTRLYSLPLKTLHVLYESTLTLHFTDVGSPEHRLQGNILDISSNRLFKAVRVDDSIETKNRPFLKIKFANKGIDALNLSNILNQKSVQSNIPP